MTAEQIFTNVVSFQNTSTKIYFVDAPIGAGKTYSSLRHIKENPDDMFVVATQTNQLSLSYARELKNLNITHKVIMVDKEQSHPRTCRRRFANAVRGKHKVIIVNQTVAMRRFKKPLNRVLILDEVPNIYDVKSIDFAQIPLLAEAFIAVFSQADRLTEVDGYYDLTITKALVDIKTLLVKHLHLDQELKKIFVILCDPNYRALVDAKRFGRVMKGLKETLFINFFCKPTVFDDYRETIIVGANFERSILFHYWKSEVDFVVHEGIRARLQYTSLAAKAPFVRLYGLSERNISDGRFNEIDGGRQAYVDAASDAFEVRFGSINHIWTTNNEKTTQKPYRYKSKGKRVTYVSPDPRGSNDYLDYDAAIHMGALNPIPETFHVLHKVCGMSQNDVFAATAWERIYQWLGRTSLRVDGCVRPVTLVCPDLASARHVQSLIPGCADPEFIDLGFTALLLHTPADDSERSAEKRVNQRLDAQNQVPQTDGFPFCKWERKEFQPILAGTDSFQGIFAYLEHAALTGARPADKLDGKMFRGGDGVTSRLLILDIDKCKRDPRELSLWLSQNDITHQIFFTHSSTIQKPRVRVVIPLSEIVDEAGYAHVFKLLRSDIWVRFDKDYRVDAGSCGNVNSRFFMPTISECGAPIENIVWEEIFSQKAKLLDVRFFLTRSLKEARAAKSETEKPTSDTTVSTVDPHEIISRFAVPPSRSDEPGKGDENFFEAAKAFRKAGFAQQDAEFYLHQNRKLFGRGKDAKAGKRVTEYVYRRKAA